MDQLTAAIVTVIHAYHRIGPTMTPTEIPQRFRDLWNAIDQLETHFQTSIVPQHTPTTDPLHQDTLPGLTKGHTVAS